MTDEQPSNTLKELYDKVLLAFETASDKAEDLVSLRKSEKIWLENVISSLISWGIDTRVDAGSLSAIEGNPLENEVRSTLGELQAQLYIYEGRNFQEVSSLSKSATPVVPELPPIPDESGSVAGKSSKSIMLSLIDLLQDTVRSIRMIHASKKQEGPYRKLKQKIDNIYNQHIEQKAQNEPLTSRSSLVNPLLEEDSYLQLANDKEILSHQFESSVSSRPADTSTPFAKGSVIAKSGSSGENKQQSSSEPGIKVQGLDINLSESEDLWSDIGIFLRKNCQKNWEGALFMIPQTLLEIMSDETMKRVLQTMGTRPYAISWRTWLLENEIMDYRKILAICLYARLGPSFFALLLIRRFSDKYLPLENEHLQTIFSHFKEDRNLEYLQRFRDSQGAFLPIRLGLTQSHLQLDDSAVLPIQYDPEHNLIGRGAFGEIYSVRIHLDLHQFPSCERFALKRFAGIPNAGTVANNSERMLKQMSMLNHPNLVQQLSTWSYCMETFILFPIGDTNLRHLLENERPPTSLFDQAKLLEQFYHITRAVRFLHDHDSSRAAKTNSISDRQTSLRGCHMDLRPENILVFQNANDTETWRIADFGLSNTKGISYASPDLFSMPFQIASDHKDLGRQYDVWALGCMLLEILWWIAGGENRKLGQLSKLGELWYKGSPKHTATLKPEIVNAFTILRQNSPGIFFNEIVDLVRSMLEVDHKRRPDVLEVKNRLAGILAQMPGCSYVERLQDAAAETTATESLDESERSFAASGDVESGTQTPDTDYSSLAGVQAQAKWQTRRMYPLLLQGLEPEPLHEDIVTTFIRYTRSKPNFQPSSKRSDSRPFPLKHAVLQSLSFPRMGYQEYRIQAPLAGTFAWIFRDPNSLFLGWLNENGNGNDKVGFWIKGIPGSGKSTLMKFIAWELRHKREVLDGRSSRVIITHFFWEDGSPLEHSQHGFLLSLLHQLIHERSDLLPTLFVDLWEATSTYGAEYLESLLEGWHNWSLFQLNRLLGDFLALLDREDRFLLLIDALDECDHNDLEEVIALIRQLSSTQNFKVCFSSRPQVMVMQAFHLAPGFHLEDATLDDIELYVKYQTSRILQKDKEAIGYDEFNSMITRKIIDNANGLFMWVQLVVDSIARCSTPAIVHQLDLVPVDTYDMICKKIPLQSQIDASMFFQILVKSPQPLSLTTLYFAVGEENVSMEQAAKNLMNEDLKEKFSHRILSSCMGLLEVQLSDSGESIVTFIHYSVKKYLELPLIQIIHDRRAARRGFDVNVALLRASVFQVHTMMASTQNWKECKNTIKLAMNYAREAERTTGQAQTALLDSLDEVVGGILPPAPLLEYKLPSSNTAVHWSAAIVHEPDEDSCEYCPDSFLEFAVMNGLTLYVTRKISRMSAEATAAKKPLLFYATIAPQKHYPSSPPQVQMVKALLKRRADPNEKFGESVVPLQVAMTKTLLKHGSNPNKRVKYYQDPETTPWELMLNYLTLEYDKNHQDFWLVVCDLFLCHGADPLLRVSTGSVSRGATLSVPKVMRLAFNRLPSSLEEIFVGPGRVLIIVSRRH